MKLHADICTFSHPTLIYILVYISTLSFAHSHVVTHIHTHTHYPAYMHAHTQTCIHMYTESYTRSHTVTNTYSHTMPTFSHLTVIHTRVLTQFPDTYMDAHTHSHTFAYHKLTQM